jgi:HrpA-like RNA helicase
VDPSSDLLSGYAAAGVLLYRYDQSELKVLLGVEWRAKERGCVLNLLGGKRDIRENNPMLTAAREFCEESGNFVDIRKMNTVLSTASVAWLGFGKYVLYTAQCPPSLYDLDKQYNNLSANQRSFHAEMDLLLWVRWNDLVSTVKKHKDPTYTIRSFRNIVSYNLSEFMIKLLSYEQLVENLVQSSTRDSIPLFLKQISDEVDRSKEQISVFDNSHQRKKHDLIDSSWRLRLVIPAVVHTEPPIKPLLKDSKDYNDIAKVLPEDFQQKIVSIHKVRVENRIAIHQQEEQQLKSNDAIVKIIEKTYHGTPEPWRARNIAFKGFDLSIVLNGRAKGNGVYTSTDIKVPLGYSKDAGSIVQMRGIVTKQDDTSDQHIVVFRNPNQVLPTAIINFAADPNISMEDECKLIRQKQEEDAKQKAELMKEIKEQEKSFMEQIVQRVRKSITYYNIKMEAIKTEIESILNQAVGSATMSNEIRANILGLWRRFEMEKAQFDASPTPAIYAEKGKLIDMLINNDVVIITAGTGSGKSTQVPQYLLDDVLPFQDKRRIAVLEPRRFNVISLCQRVSKERNQQMGMEIGYRLGLGDICTSSATRIEYMTHGVFINKALDPESLINNYAAIVLDEAHERSVDVDMCFSLLQKVLEFNIALKDRDRISELSTNRNGRNSSLESQREKWKDFKVVVASATVSDSQIEEFRSFLSMENSNFPLRSDVFVASGCAFPVLTIHKPEAEPNWEEANSIEVSKALASYATEVAIDIIRSSKSDGNILVFMPGESIINLCMNSMRSWTIFNDNDQRNSTKDTNDAQPSSIVGLEDFQFEITLDDEDQEDDKHKHKNKMKRKIVVGVYPFHGKVSDTLKQKMIFHTGQDRVIIFSTNAAETGLTLPNIRYVIDTGLERRVIWNCETCVPEMKTVQITKSSMKQRAGRAGRVGSGICVCLYSEETANNLADTTNTEIESGQVLRTVLLLDSKPTEEFKLLSEIPEASKKSTERVLETLGALAKDCHGNYQITTVGHTLNKLGLNLRVGKFLLACNDFGCLGSGADIVAILSVSNNLSLLPSREYHPQKNPFPAHQFIDEWGDHFTLMNMFQSYCNAPSRNQFCLQNMIDSSIFEEAVRIREHLDILCMDVMQASVVDTPNLDNTELKRRLRCALCAAYFDQIMSSCSPGQPTRKFVRVLPAQEFKQLQEANQAFAENAGLNQVLEPDSIASLVTTSSNGKNLIISAAEKDMSVDSSSGKQLSSDIAKAVQNNSIQQLNSNHGGNSDMSASLQQYYNADSMVSLPAKCSLFYLEHCNQSLSHAQSLALFGSIMLTDTNRGPVVQYVSYINPEDVQAGARNWSDEVNFQNLFDKLEIKYVKIPISDNLATFLLSGNRYLLNKFTIKQNHIKANVNKAERCVELHAPSFAIEGFRSFLRKLEQKANEASCDQEKIQIELDRRLTKSEIALIVKHLGANAKEKFDYIKQLNDILRDATRDEDSLELKHRQFIPFVPSDILVDGRSDPCTVTVTLKTCAKCFAPLIIGNINSYISSLLPNRKVAVPYQMRTESSSLSSEVLIMPNLALLSASSPPAFQDTRAAAILYIAHVAIWKARCSIYGGFIRDFVVRGERPNDLDCGFYPSTIARSDLVTMMTNEINAVGLHISKAGDKGMAYALTVRSNSGGYDFDVDLVDLSATSSLIAPGVDCDVGNLMLQAPQSNTEFPLKLKINNRKLVSLEDSILHCKNRQFVFYYTLQGAATSEIANKVKVRFSKYIRRGWTCINTVDQGLLPENCPSNLYAPQPEYNCDYSKCK